MRGADDGAGSLFSYIDLESRISVKHPLRAIRAIVNEALSTLDADFAGLYSGDVPGSGVGAPIFGGVRSGLRPPRRAA